MSSARVQFWFEFASTYSYPAAMRAACSAKDEPWLPDFVCVVYRVNFSEDTDISKPETVATCLRSVRREPDGRLARAQSSETKALPRAQTERVRALGIFGAPTFVSGAELFRSHDRPEEVLAWHREHA